MSSTLRLMRPKMSEFIKGALVGGGIIFVLGLGFIAWWMYETNPWRHL